MKIGEASQILGVNPQTLYFYERIGLIPPLQRTQAGYRLFNENDIARLRFITRAKTLGLSLDEIKEILVLQDGQALTCEAMHFRLVTKVQQLEDQIHNLQALRDELLPLVKRCQGNLTQAVPMDECVVVKEICDGTKNLAMG